MGAGTITNGEPPIVGLVDDTEYILPPIGGFVASIESPSCRYLLLCIYLKPY